MLFVLRHMPQQAGRFVVQEISNINQAIRTILNPLYFFYMKVSHAEKARKAYKQTKTKKTTFLCA